MICHLVAYTNKYGMRCYIRYYSQLAAEAEAERLRTDTQRCASDVQVTLTTDEEHDRMMALRWQG